MTFLRALRADGALAPVPVTVAKRRTGSGLIQQVAALVARHHFVKAGHSMGGTLDAVRESLGPRPP